MIESFFEIPIEIDRELFEARANAEIRTLEIRCNSTDNLHNKYVCSTSYPQDFINLGLLIASMSAISQQIHEIGYCLVTKKGEVIAPYIVDLTGENNHLDQYDTFLRKWHINKNKANYCVEKLCLVGKANQQYYKQFKYVGNGESDFKHISNGLNAFSPFPLM